MGFAKSFSDSFNNSYSISAKTRAAREESEYEWKMKGLFEEKEARTKAEARESKAQADARSIAEQTGKPVKDVYDRLVAGSDPSVVLDWAKNTIGGPQSVDSEMVGSGLAASESPVDRLLRSPDGEVPTASADAPVNDPQASRGVSNAPTQTGGTAYRPKPKTMDPAEQVANLQREYSLASTSPERKEAIANELREFGAAKDLVDPPQDMRTGRTREDLIASGQQPVEGVSLVDGKPKLQLLVANPETGGWMDANTGEPVEQARRVTEPEQASLDKIMSSADSQAVVEQREKMQGVADSLRIGKDIIEMANANPDITSSFTGSVAGVVSTLRREAGTSLSLLDQALKAKGGIDPKLLAQAEEEVNSIDLSALDVADRFAAEQGLYEAKKNILIYKVGQALGQTGQGFSDQDFKRIENGIFAGKGKDIQRSIGDYLQNTIRDVNSGAALINDFNTANKEHYNRYGYYPIEGNVAPTVEEFIATQDPSAQDGLALINSAPTETPNVPKTNNPNAPGAGRTKTGVTWSIE